jgi:hypothetical protein
MIVTDKEYYMDKAYVSKLDLMIKRMQGSDDNLLPIDGDEGCLTGDTLIQCSRFKLSRRYTIKRLYNHFNNNPDGIIPKKKLFNLKEPTKVRSFNGEGIRLHKIKNVFYSGKKKVWEIKLANGKNIKASANHKFLTEQGWTRLDKLKVGNSLMCDKLNASKNGRKKIKLYDIRLTADHHPYKIGNRVEVYRLIYEARMNNLTFLKYLDILLNEPDQAKKLKYIDPNKYSIHHKDGFHYNNSIENLELIKKEDHLKKYHYENNYVNFSQGIPTFSKIVSIIYKGVEDTYDIECEDPYHNFCANGIVVHNSGKSEFATGTCYYVAYKTGRKYGVDNVFFKLEEAIEFAGKTKEQIIHIDEGALGLLSMQWWNKNQQKFLQLAMVARKKKHFIVICIPQFNRLNRYVIEDRAIGLVHVYARKNLKKGYFVYFKKEAKNNLYREWSKRGTKNYVKYYSLRGTFVQAMKRVFTPEQIEAYEKKKDQAIVDLVEDKEKRKPREKDIKKQIYLNFKKKFPDWTLKQIANSLGLTEDMLKKYNVEEKQRKENEELDKLIEKERLREEYLKKQQEIMIKA